MHTHDSNFIRDLCTVDDDSCNAGYFAYIYISSHRLIVSSRDITNRHKRDENNNQGIFNVRFPFSVCV
jgi:hypothetical protein